jgi:hypothetical protein
MYNFFYGGEIEAVIFWGAVPCSLKTSNYESETSLGRQQCSGYTSLVTNFNPEDGGSKASETLVSNHRNPQHNNPGKCHCT